MWLQPWNRRWRCVAILTAVILVQQSLHPYLIHDLVEKTSMTNYISDVPTHINGLRGLSVTDDIIKISTEEKKDSWDQKCIMIALVLENNLQYQEILQWEAFKAASIIIIINSMRQSDACVRQWTSQVMTCDLVGAKPLSQPLLEYC